MENLFFATGWRKHAWLVAGITIGLFGTNSEWAIPVAGWLFSIGLMRFTRSSGVLAGLLCVVLSSAATTVVYVAAAGQFEVLPILLGCLVLSLILSVPLLVDRLLFRRLPAFAGSLVFPATRAAAEFLVAAVSPLGTIFGPLAATQSTNLPLLQLASVTGVYGISFVMAWVAPVVNMTLERRLSWPSIRGGTLAYVSVLGLVLLGGGLRLAMAPTPPSLVRVAGVSASLTAEARMREIDNFHTPSVQPEQKPVLRKAFAVLNDDLLAHSRIEADGGAKIVAWPETAAVVLADDYADFLRAAQDLARAKQIYLDMGIAVILDGAPGSRDIAVLVAPDGQVLSTFDKAHPVPGMENLRPGNGIVPVSGTPYGSLANVICFDADFPGTLRTHADIMFVPANDWKGIEHMHAANAVFRAVENGYTLIRQTSNGIAITVDPYGANLARTNYFSTTRQTMVASVPTRGTWTVYGLVGDLFAWLCAAAAAGLGALAVFRPVEHPGQK
ncbi:nitrilase-related carbon-nitrogen hydrolase [Actinocrispum wychmicini]|uniref:Apolipoprotein N-acyltransferase n=1 Tax=Actinocrispum wychmicini TaxID=1213861 RepID=A0A4V2S819_9PSEU|nr:nitrilase-related carbon-nitrogen hydrolase [Actinocrispum wychmicini]TCO62180.1 apolipoprotein N-acyltransferase [Actinocrispum wychmicini]